MLTLTPNATTVIRSILDEAELPASAGVRIASTEDGQQGITVLPAATPEAGDQVVEDNGARVFVEANAASMLGETILDAEVDTDGNYEFLLTAQAD